MITKFIPAALFNLLIVSALSSSACSAQASDSSLDSLRQLTTDDKLTGESVVYPWSLDNGTYKIHTASFGLPFLDEEALSVLDAR